MTEAELAEIEQRASDATPGPWLWENPCAERFCMERLIHVDTVFSEQNLSHVEIETILKPYVHGPVEATENVFASFGPDEEDGAIRAMANLEFIAHSRVDVDRLCAEVRRLWKMLDAANESNRQETG